MHADRSNRAALIIFAAILTAIGALGVATSYGLLGRPVKHQRMLDNAFARYIGRNSEWFWIIVALIALLIVLITLRWLLTILFSTDRTSTIRITTDGPGRTELASGALTDALTREIDAYRGVHSARARIIGDPQDAKLIITVTVEESADLPSLVKQIEDNAHAHARAALSNPTLPITLNLSVTDGRSSRVS